MTILEVRKLQTNRTVLSCPYDLATSKYAPFTITHKKARTLLIDVLHDCKFTAKFRMYVTCHRQSIQRSITRLQTGVVIVMVA